MGGLVRHLIVAQWEEDVGWTQAVEGWEPLIVRKGSQLANIGREASSYFWGLHHLYDRLTHDSLVCCVQGDPFFHKEDFPAILYLDIPKGFHGVGDRYHCDARGNPNHPNLPVGELFERWVGGEAPREFEFTAGAQFIVSGDLVLRRPKEEYEQMILAVAEERYGPWVFERIWRYYFEAEILR